jgi:hypothetical protein
VAVLASALPFKVEIEDNSKFAVKVTANTEDPAYPYRLDVTFPEDAPEGAKFRLRQNDAKSMLLDYKLLQSEDSKTCSCLLRKKDHPYGDDTENVFLLELYTISKNPYDINPQQTLMTSILKINTDGFPTSPLPFSGMCFKPQTD